MCIDLERIYFDKLQYKQGGLYTESTKGRCLCTVNQTGKLVLKVFKPVHLNITFLGERICLNIKIILHVLEPYACLLMLEVSYPF